MIWTFLRSCYSFSMRVFVGGQAMTFPARWYFCAKGAKLFPSPHGAEASPWLKNYEVNADWGEVTPYPTDPTASASRGVDRGLNPGYPGLCFVGQPQWFVDGQLPPGILQKQPPPFPACCKPTPARSSGGIVLSGQATPGRGGIINTCILCPAGSPKLRSVSFSGGTGVWAVLNGRFTITYVAGCTWRFGALPGFQIELVGRVSPPTWNLSVSIPAPNRSALYSPAAPFDCVYGAPYSLVSSVPAGAPPNCVVGP